MHSMSYLAFYLDELGFTDDRINQTLITIHLFGDIFTAFVKI